MDLNSNMEYKGLVSVCMITYNHENFIKDAIEGILKQNIKFDLELIIADDKSTDKTQSVVEKCIVDNRNSNFEIIYKRHTVNKGMSNNFGWALNQCKGKYIALCEGDDYWTDPYKLQKQVDLLESNEDYVLACHRYNFIDEENQFIKKDPFEDVFIQGKNYVFDANKYLERFVTQTCTLMFEKKYFDLSWIIKYQYFRDKSLYYEILRTSGRKGVLTSENDAVYRIQDGGVYTSLNNVELKKTHYKVNVEIFIKNRVELKHHSLKKQLKKQNTMLLKHAETTKNNKFILNLLKDAYFLNTKKDYYYLLKHYLKWILL